MYRMVIVDDDEIEREGMTDFIPWESYGIEIVGSAWNGQEGYEIIHTRKPDLVITDIKMPVMNGIELIRKVKEENEEILFVVLSGYGEYEYTSQAMELGIRHYVLKPCDEKRIVAVLEQAKRELEEVRKKRALESIKNERDLKSVFTKAKEQFFHDALLSDVGREAEYDFYQEAGGVKGNVRLLSVRTGETKDYLHQFVIQNIVVELLEGHVAFKTSMENESLFLLQEVELEQVKKAVDKLQQEYGRFDGQRLESAVSREGRFTEIRKLYEEIRSRYAFEGKEQKGLKISQEELLEIYRAISRSSDLQTLLLNISVLYAWLRICHYSGEESSSVGVWLVNYLEDGKSEGEAFQGGGQLEVSRRAVQVMRQRGKLEREKTSKEKSRMEDILTAVYSNIGERNLGLHWLAAEVVFMNEEYLGRLFARNMKQKFSDFVSEVRIEIAKRLLEHIPELHIADLAECVGYSADGQYFSRMFKKYTGKKPSDYKEDMQRNGETENG